MPDGFPRRLILHPAHELVGVACAERTIRIDRAHSLTLPEAPPRGMSVGLVPGAMDDGWHESLAVLAEQLRGDRDSPCRPVLVDDDSCAGEDLVSCQCLVLLGRPAVSNRARMRQIEAYCRSGRPLVALRSASRAFPRWPGFDREVLGGDYRGQHDTTEFQVRPVAVAGRHPLLTGVDAFVAQGSLYENPWLAADATVLLVGFAEDRMEPVAWCRGSRGRRIFYTSLGHPDDFREPSFLRLVTNAIHWACRCGPK